jgi:hypothetical protein
MYKIKYYLKHIGFLVGRDGVAIITKRYGLDVLGIEPGLDRDSLHSSILALWSTQTPI